MRVAPGDMVVDLGSGDGRMVIAAARRGARARGVEFNPDMVSLSRHRAYEAGVQERAKFVEGDMYEADISDASVMALFLLTENMRRLQPKFLQLRPGTRIVSNTFAMPEWPADDRRTRTDCTAWCTALLWIVPAKVAGTHKLPQVGDLVLKQEFQVLSGTLTTGGKTFALEGKVRGDDVTVKAGGKEYHGKMRGKTLEISLFVHKIV